MVKRFELRNLVTDPATDDALVDGLLAVANGAELVIVGQPARPGAEYNEPRSDEDDVRRYADVLQTAITGDNLLPMFTDRVTGRRWPVSKVIRLQGAQATEALPAELRSVAAVTSERVLIARPGGYSLGYFRHFPDAASALSEAALLVVDPTRPYVKALCRCKLPRCQNFYLARKKPNGGGENRLYCISEHRTEYNNSAQRKKDSSPQSKKNSSTQSKHKNSAKRKHK